MARFSMFDGKLQFDDRDGPMTAEEAHTYTLLEMKVTLQSVDESLKSIDFTLDKGELKVHRTQ